MAVESRKGKITASAEIPAEHHLSKIGFYLRLFLIIAIITVFAFWMDYWIRGELGMAKKFIQVLQSQWGVGALIAGGCIYILLLSLPFVPGVELGVLLMCAFGKEGIVFVYLSTVAGLGLAFMIGRLVPRKWIRFGLQKLGLSRFYSDGTGGIESMADQLQGRQKYFPHRLASFLLKYRYPALAVLINLPGNYILGGGGGVSLACGMNPNISARWFLLTIVLAVSPVPMLAYFGIIQLEAFFGI